MKVNLRTTEMWRIKKKEMWRIKEGIHLAPQMLQNYCKNVIGEPYCEENEQIKEGRGISGFSLFLNPYTFLAQIFSIC